MMIDAFANDVSDLAKRPVDERRSAMEFKRAMARKLDAPLLDDLGNDIEDHLFVGSDASRGADRFHHRKAILAGCELGAFGADEPEFTRAMRTRHEAAEHAGLAAHLLDADRLGRISLELHGPETKAFLGIDLDLGPLPKKRILRHRPDVVGIDPPLGKGLNERFAISPPVVRDHVMIGGDQRTKIVAKSHVDGWAIVDGPNADREELTSQLAHLGDKKVLQPRRDIAIRQFSGSTGGELDVALGLSAIQCDEGGKDGSREYAPQVVGLMPVVFPQGGFVGQNLPGRPILRTVQKIGEVALEVVEGAQRCFAFTKAFAEFLRNRNEVLCLSRLPRVRLTAERTTSS